MKRRNHIWLVAALLSLLLLGAGATRPYWFPEVNVGGGYDAGGVSIDALGNIWVAGKIYGDVESTIEGLSTTGAAGTAPVSQGDGTLAMEGVYRPGYFIGAADIPTSITVGATGNVHQAALPASVVFNTDFFTGATESEAGVAGIVPGGAAGALNRFLCVDGTWAVPFIGAVVGPGASTHAAVAIWDGTTGDKVKNSLVQITSSGGIVIPGTISVGSGGHVLTNAAGKIDGGKLQPGTVTSYELSATGVSAGYYNLPALTVDAAGRVLAITDGALEIRELSDGPAEYGLAYQVLVMNAAGDGWEWTGAVNPSVLPHLAGDTGSGGVAGIAPAPGTGDAAAGKFLSADGTWATPSGAGNVAGPGTSTNNAIALFDGAGGQTLQDSSITSPDGDSLTIPGTVTLGSGNHVIANSAGLLDGGKLQAGSVNLAGLDIAGGTTVSATDDADLIVLYSETASANRVMARSDFLSGVGGGGGASAFTDLSDAPGDYSDAGGMVVKVNPGATGLEFATDAVGATAFTDLTDAPASLTANKFLAVNSGGTAIEFVDAPSGGNGGGASTFVGLTDTPASFANQAGRLLAVNAGETALEYVGPTIKRPILLTATGAVFRAADGADGPTLLQTATNGNLFFTVDFDPTVNEYAHWTCISVPEDYIPGGVIEARINWTATAGAAGDVVWRVGALAFGDGDSLDAAPGDEATITDTFQGAGKLHQTAIEAIDVEGDLAAGALITVYVYRDAAAVGDTFTEDAGLINVELSYEAYVAEVGS